MVDAFYYSHHFFSSSVLQRMRLKNFLSYSHILYARNLCWHAKLSTISFSAMYCGNKLDNTFCLHLPKFISRYKGKSLIDWIHKVENAMKTLKLWKLQKLFAMVNMKIKYTASNSNISLQWLINNGVVKFLWNIIDSMMQTWYHLCLLSLEI